ncbi:MAG: hypothetical protein QGF20_10390 [Alphaproteobacteria bacterium]|jgi:hypothetical protein|nr:hypothetical protein [Alphaproteobacteria bacterium]
MFNKDRFIEDCKAAVGDGQKAIRDLLLEAAGAESMGPGQAATLGPEIIHSVANPIRKLTSAIHVYGGDFFNPPQPRSQWDHETLIEVAWDMDNTRKVFRQADQRFKAGLAAGAED